MKATFCAQTALFITRSLRARSKHGAQRHRRCSIVDPDISPRKRMSRKAWQELVGAIAGLPFAEETVHIAVANSGKRFRSRCAQSHVFGNESGLPSNSFVSIAQAYAMSSPELLFVEMANRLSPAEHLLLGYELCGSFAFDATDPKNGTATLDIAPATSVERLDAFLGKTRWLRGARQARETLERLADNAWSPTEAIIATLASLPVTEFGYDLGPLLLNRRVQIDAELANTTDKRSRVPDILLAGTNVGLNYDGAVHLDLESVVDAAIETERHPESPVPQTVLNKVLREVRGKAVDDIRRNRELAAEGYIVFPVTKEDLYEQGGLDRIMLQAMAAIGRFDGTELSKQQGIIANPSFADSRQELIWSLLPGDSEARITRMRREHAKGRKTEVIETIINLGI